MKTFGSRLRTGYYEHRPMRIKKLSGTDTFRLLVNWVFVNQLIGV